MGRTWHVSDPGQKEARVKNWWQGAGQVMCVQTFREVAA